MKEYKYKINGNEYNVTINSVEGNIANVSVNGTVYEVEMENTPKAQPQAQVQETVKKENEPQTAAPQQAEAKSVSGKGKQVTSPLPGVIIEVSVKEGQTVKAGEKVAIIEAMKMENEITASESGTITSIHVNKGDSVLEGAPIVTIA